jgi:hypothetical protein
VLEADIQRSLDLHRKTTESGIIAERQVLAAATQLTDVRVAWTLRSLFSEMLYYTERKGAEDDV